uniref:Uncharacterized protein AlNc14C1G166 n=1 Tax=Albugo laibachii Nc14 TaxID=890382 RepID=F0VZ22_9STRA|nr:conserved hypothetical protein [Albugo laibachii Nc14]|eukprot:CCA14037.1 conserved hypothetical protein [Albugo laibachii Nc14]
MTKRAFKWRSFWRSERSCLRHLFLLLLLTTTMAFDWKTMMDRTQTSVQSAIEWAGYHSGLADQCCYVDKPSTAARNHLTEHIIAQHLAVESIIAAIEAWEFARPTAKDRIPLVLAFTGPTGTGKTETSYVLARSIFKHTRNLYKSDKKVASGLLMIRGEDFSDNFTNPVTTYHRLIKSMLVDHLIHCSGNAIVVFDEVQKVIPHTLDVLMEAMSNSAQLSYTVGGVTSTLDTSNVIFILISDIGVSQMMGLIRKYPSRNEVSALKLEQTVKAALDAQWKRLEFGKIVNKVVPFLPLQQPDIQSIIASKLETMDRTYRGKRWHRLWIDPSLPQHLSLLDSIHYEQRKVTINGETTLIQLYAKYGARNVENGPLQQLKSKLFRFLRPWNSDSEVKITIDVGTNTISIIACAAEKNGSQDAELIPVDCVTRWKGMIE